MDGGGHSIPPLCTSVFNAYAFAHVFDIYVWVTLERNLPLRE